MEFDIELQSFVLWFQSKSSSDLGPMDSSIVRVKLIYIEIIKKV